MIRPKKIKRVSYEKDAIVVIYIDGSSEKLKSTEINLALVAAKMAKQSETQTLRDQGLPR